MIFSIDPVPGRHIMKNALHPVRESTAGKMPDGLIPIPSDKSNAAGLASLLRLFL